MSLRDVGRALDDWVAAGRTVAIATLVQARHSAPLPPGARFAVNDRGELEGSISNGCVEGDLYEHLRAIISGAPASVLHYGITDDMASDVGLTCGGEIDVLVELHDASSLAWSELLRAVRDGEPAVLVTGLSKHLRSRKLLVLENGSEGSLGERPFDDQVVELARPYLESGGTDVVSLEAASGRASDVFVEAHLPPPRLAIVGATSIGFALCRIATLLGYQVDVIDPRSALADPAKMPDAQRVLHAWPDDGLGEIGLSPHVDVVVLTHDGKLDVPALASALRAGCRYVGLLGGKRTQEHRREALRGLGFDETDLERIHGPVGLAIGSETPEEIALSIVAELVETRRRS